MTTTRFDTSDLCALPRTSYSTWAQEFLFTTASIQVRVALLSKTGRPGTHEVHWAIETPEHATGYRRWDDGMWSADDASASAAELCEQLITRGWDELS